MLLCLTAACGGNGPSALPPPPDVAAVAEILDAAGARAIAEASRDVERKPEDAERWRRLGNLYEARGLPAQAEASYTVAARLAPDDARLHYRAALNARNADLFDDALRHLERTLEVDPTYGPAWRRKGQWALETGDVAAARVAFSRADPLLPGVADVPLCFARAALLADELDEALRQTRSALERAPKDPYVRLVHGTALRRAGRLDEAEAHLIAGQGATPTFADPWTAALLRARENDEDLSSRARQMEAERRWDEAIALYREVLERRPDDSGVMHRLGVALSASGQPDDALAHLDGALVRFPAHHDLLIARVGALHAAGRTGDALRSIDEIIARWDDRPTAYLVRGTLLRDTGDPEGALLDFARASRLAPNDLRARLFQGQVLLREKRWTEAERVLAEGLSIPGAAPSLPYFRMLMQAQARCGSGNDVLSATLRRARDVHGDAAESLVRER